jgi:hypothetical protein
VAEVDLVLSAVMVRATAVTVDPVSILIVHGYLLLALVFLVILLAAEPVERISVAEQVLRAPVAAVLAEQLFLKMVVTQQLTPVLVVAVVPITLVPVTVVTVDPVLSLFVI